ncbi:MAG: hypothetical protein NTY37_09130 [Methanothrix sp.]|nr:hypothetical protein [Methanothrix sp.]
MEFLPARAEMPADRRRRGDLRVGGSPGPARARACTRATVKRIEPGMNIGVDLAQEHEMTERS